MQNRFALPLLVMTSAIALAQSPSVSGNPTDTSPETRAENATSTAPEPHTESNPAELPNSMSAPAASADPGPYIEMVPTIPLKPPSGEHTGFFDKRNMELLGLNIAAQTQALVAIQAHGKGLESRGRTLDPFEKHFESYGYGWGAVYRYVGGVGLSMYVAYIFHATGHHKMERWVPVVAIGHALASSGYALTGSKQGCCGW